MPLGITFNGRHSSQIPGIKDVTIYTKYLFPEIENDLVTIEGMDGVLDNGYTVKEQFIPVSFRMNGASIPGYFLKAEGIAKWLNTKTVAPLILDALPNRTFMARINGKVDPNRVAARSEFEVVFLVPSGTAEGIQVNRNIVRKQVYQYNGSYETFPSFSITVKERMDFLRLLHIQSGKFILINRPFNINDIITIDMKTREIMLNGVTDLRKYLDVTADYFTIESDHSFDLNGSLSTIQMVYVERWL